MNPKETVRKTVSSSGKTRRKKTAQEKIKNLQIRVYKRSSKERPSLISQKIEIASSAKIRILRNMLQSAVRDSSFVLRITVRVDSIQKYLRAVYEGESKGAEKILGYEHVYGIKELDLDEFPIENEPTEDDREEFGPLSPRENAQITKELRFHKYCSKVARNQLDRIRCRMQVLRWAEKKHFEIFSSKLLYGEFVEVARSFKSVGPDQLKRLGLALRNCIGFVEDGNHSQMVFDLYIVTSTETRKDEKCIEFQTA